MRPRDEPIRFVLNGFGAATPPPGTIVLTAYQWNDWFEFRTTFGARYVDDSGNSHELGSVKIADFLHVYSDSDGQQTPLESSFTELDPNRYASVGQTEEYYERCIAVMGLPRARNALAALADLAENPVRLEAARQHRVVTNSLMREVAAATIKNKLHRIVGGSGGNAAFDFHFIRPTESPLPLPPTMLQFSVEPDSSPPTNVHALIGRNGSGKTTILRSMAKAMLGAGIRTDEDGHFATPQGAPLDIANLVYVSFSAFDVMSLPVLDKQLQWAVPYSYVGLQFPVNYEPDPPGPEMPENMTVQRGTRPAQDLEAEFSSSALQVIKKGFKATWAQALQTLESDPNFNEADVSRLAKYDINESNIETQAKIVWKSLSTGHKIVLLTITRLVETVIERTLVLVDEPEGHLHPPLLSALVRALSDLLKERNGVALVATHSPVVIQEVPSRCVTKLRRVGLAQAAERPAMETFGESVGVLTSEVFSLEVSDSGFHRMLTDAALELGSYDEVVSKFGEQLGFEARAVLSSWFATQAH